MREKGVFLKTAQCDRDLVDGIAGTGLFPVVDTNVINALGLDRGRLLNRTRHIVELDQRNDARIDPGLLYDIPLRPDLPEPDLVILVYNQHVDIYPPTSRGSDSKCHFLTGIQVSDPDLVLDVQAGKVVIIYPDCCVDIGSLCRCGSRCGCSCLLRTRDSSTGRGPRRSR